jgi:hypothetical protein
MPALPSAVLRPLLAATVVLASLVAATQWTAALLAHHPALGAPWLDLLGLKLYAPWKVFSWWLAFGAQAPGVFARTGTLAAIGGVMAGFVASGGAARRAGHGTPSTTYGSARWARSTDVHDAGLATETLALFVRYMLTVTPPIPDGDQEPARLTGRKRFDVFLAEVGKRVAAKDGYAGSIRTLMLNGRVRILANDRKNSESAPDFRISLGTTEIGAAWRRTKQGTDQTLPPRAPRRSRLAATDLGRAHREHRRRPRAADLAPRYARGRFGQCAVMASTPRPYAGARVLPSTAPQAWLVTRIDPPRRWTRQEDRRSNVNRRAAQPRSPALSCSSSCRS